MWSVCCYDGIHIPRPPPPVTSDVGWDIRLTSWGHGIAVGTRAVPEILLISTSLEAGTFRILQPGTESQNSPLGSLLSAQVWKRDDRCGCLAAQVGTRCVIALWCAGLV